MFYDFQFFESPTRQHNASAGYDANGNIIAWVNTADGILSGTREYGAFGENIAATGVGVLDEWSGIPFGFSTKYQDRLTSHYYYGYRFYDTSSGRWLSRDPIEEQGGLNLYAFVGNNGVNLWDLLGMYVYTGDSIDGIPSMRAFAEWQESERRRSARMAEGFSACAGYGSGEGLKCCDSWKAEMIDDLYPKRARAICDEFIIRYDGSPETICVAKCLTGWEKGTQRKFSRCEERNTDRLIAHFSCYAVCGFVPNLFSGNLGIPDGGWALGLGELFGHASFVLTKDLGFQ